MSKLTTYEMPDTDGRYGHFGGRFVPELLMPALLELDEAYEEAIQDPNFMKELDYYLQQYVERETPLYHAQNLSKELNSPQMYLKREELKHTGAHKIINTIGKAYLTTRMRKKKNITEIGA